MGIKKRRISRWFQICWKSFQKKLLAKTWRKYALFPLLLMFVKLIYYTFFDFYKKNCFRHISTFFNFLSQMRQKSKNVLSKCVF
jgi:hypothetical protein